MEVVAAGKPHHQIAAFGFEAKAQGTAAECNVGDFLAVVAVVAVAFATAFAAALQLLPGIEYEKELHFAPTDVLHPAGSDVAVQVFQSADTFVSALKPVEPVLAGLFRAWGTG
jgi:hypothetical protein